MLESHQFLSFSLAMILTLKRRLLDFGNKSKNLLFIFDVKFLF